MPNAHTTSFQREPLRYLDRRLPAAEAAFRPSPGVVCIAEPTAAKRVLANPDGLFEEHSDFFHTRRGAFGPRAVQVQIGRGARKLLSEHAAERAPALAATVGRELGAGSEWPDAGNLLIHRHLRAALVAPEHEERIGGTVDEVVRRAVLAGARERRSRWSRALFRRRVFRELTREIERRVEAQRPGGPSRPRDLFDVLACSAGPGVRTGDLGELYLPFLFAVSGSVGFTLGWAVYLIGTHPRTDAEPEWIVREALRLWPVAWQLVRRPARPHEIAGEAVTPRDEVLVSPYVTHRHPAYWQEPEEFRPERWASAKGSLPFFPFGWGPHTCAAAALSLELARDVLAVLLGEYDLEVSPRSPEPHVGPSLAPPRFRLGLTHRGSEDVRTPDERR